MKSVNHPLRYSAADTYGRALVVGFLNTLIVSFVGIIITVILGTLIGIARLSSNWLVSKLAAAYIEVFQDIPVLLQLFFWYAFFYNVLPSPRQALNPIMGVFLSNRGLVFAVPESHPVYKYMGIAVVVACVVIYFLRRWARQRQARTGQPFPIFRVSLALVVGLPLVTWAVGGAPTAMNVPALKGFNFIGGTNISPEFTALLLGLIFYTAAFVAEVVRAGIQSVSKGQTEAAKSLGLRPSQVLNLVILPQALRVIIPPHDQPDVEPDQEQFPGGCHRLPRLRVRGRHHDQSDRPGHRRRGPDDDRLSELEPADIGLHELVQ